MLKKEKKRNSDAKLNNQRSNYQFVSESESSSVSFEQNTSVSVSEHRTREHSVKNNTSNHNKSAARPLSSRGTDNSDRERETRSQLEEERTRIKVCK